MRWTVELGARCNNRCAHCALGDLRAADPAPEQASVEAALAQGRAAGARVAAFVGGEPTIHDGLAAWARRALGLGYQVVQVQTNARRLAYASYARALAEAGVGELDVALYGATARVHDWHTRVDGSFEQTCAGVRNARGAKMRVGVTALVTRPSWRELPETAALAARLGADRFQLAMTRPRGGAEADFDRVVPRLGMIEERVQEAVRVARAARMLVVTDGIPACALGPYADAMLERVAGAAEARAHVAPCSACAWRAVCPGVHAEYAARVNPAELRPRGDEPPGPETLAAARAAAGRFAGLARVEPIRPERGLVRAPAVDPALVQLRVLPGKGELRVPMRRKSGDELRTLFPSLWGGDAPPTGRPTGDD
jgi:hypothetical protein